MTDWAELTTQIHNLPETAKAEAMAILLANAELIIGLAQVRVRVDTGSLRDSIHIEQIGDSVIVKAGGLTAPHAPIIEAKYPFLKPSVDEVLPQINEQLKTKIQAVFDNVSAS
jgi:hypothetical protein